MPDPVTIELRVTPPDTEDVASLVVYESANPTGPFAVVKTIDVSALDPVPDTYDINIADIASENDWFAVQWKDAAGSWLTPLSPPTKSGATSFVELIVDRVRQRDMSMKKSIVIQEAEAAIERYFNKNPYSVTMADIPESRTYSVMNGLTYLAMARSYLALSTSESSVQSATLGLVSFRSESGKERSVDVEALIALANVELGINTSVILEMERVGCGSYWWQITEP